MMATRDLCMMTRRWERPARLGVFAALVAGVLFGAYVGAWSLAGNNPLSDAHAYWARDLTSLYGAPVSSPDAYLYSPAFAQAFAPFSALPWAVFALLWMIVLVGTVLWLAGPWSIVVLLLPPVVLELRTGNIHLLLAAVSVLGLRWPGLWSFALLTKVTPGLGLLWFAARREWRSLAVALGVTTAIVAASAALDPALWPAWIGALRANIGSEVAPANVYPIPLAIRLPVAAAVIVWGARTDRSWTVPLGAWLAMPVLWTNSAVMLLGAVWCWRRSGIRGVAGGNRVHVRAPGSPRVDASSGR